jgi:hypothetical protein
MGKVFEQSARTFRGEHGQRKGGVRICAGADECPEGWSCELLAAVDERSVQACLPPSLQ